MLQQKSFQTRSGALNYVEGPCSGEAIVLLHGITGSWQHFAMVLSALLPRWHVFAVDYRGHGESSRVPGQYRLTDYAEDICSFLESEFPQPPTVFGHSLGGMVGILIAATRPELVRALIVGDSLLYRDTIREFQKAQTNIADLKALLSSESTVGGMARKLTAAMPESDGAFRRLMAKSYTQLDPDVLDLLSGTVGSDEDYDCSVLFPRISCPVLLLQSALMTKEDAQRAMGQLADGYVVNLEGIGHLLHYDPRGYAALNAVMMFLEGL